MEHSDKGVLVLEDGTEFEGTLFGAASNFQNDQGYGEVVFNTSLTGYQEILTDPSYYGQMIVMTNPHMGNTGVNAQDPESSRPWCAGFIVHEFSRSPSNWRSEDTLDGYLKKNGIPGLFGVDTRGLTRHLRSKGVVRGVILPVTEKSTARDLLAKLPVFEGRDLIGEVTTQEAYLWKGDGVVKNFLAPTTSMSDLPKPAGKLKVVAMDFGVKRNLLRSLEYFGCEIEVVPAHTSAKAIMDRKPDGVFLSNGPGDPAAAPYAAKAVAELIGKVPMFGVCMGHQILALALGAKTYKLKFGHRGANPPGVEQSTGKVEISSQNHGYAVDAKSLPSNVEVTHVNLNDKTVAGMVVKNAHAFSVQYHPESCPGPHDSQELFERFVKDMTAAKAGKR